MNRDLSELLTHCIRCGFCLESCPTFLETGNELDSPRGRIYLVRSAQEGKLEWREDVKPHLDLCLGCRGCETACPSGVEYGAILELARDRIESHRPDVAKRLLIGITTHPALLSVQMSVSGLFPSKRIPAFVSRMVASEKAEADLPQAQPKTTLAPLDEGSLPPIRGEVYFLEGCAMRVLFGRVNDCSKRLLRRAGYQVREVPQECCGALHAHNGDLNTAAKLGTRLIDAFHDPLPVVVNSAGCGSTLKEYGNLLNGSARSIEFQGRVFDLSEFLAAQNFQLELKKSKGFEARVAYHEACHLVHGQKISAQPKALLEAVPGLVLAELNEADLCCGSAGIYNVTEPRMARKLLDRKWKNVEMSGADVVATGNPGCHSWMAQASREDGDRIPVLHIAELLEGAFSGFQQFLKQENSRNK
jgi:glycolate oxidase iron-sulfur subunit